MNKIKIFILLFMAISLFVMPVQAVQWNNTTAWTDWTGTLLEHGNVELQEPPNDTNGLISYWSFEAQTGDTAYDVWTNNSNDGSFTDGTTGNWTTDGKFGDAIEFDG